MRNKASIVIPDEARKHAIASIRRYAGENLEQEIGDLRAALLLDHFLSDIGPSVYNQALADAQTFLAERVADLGVVLCKPEFPVHGARTG